MGQRRGGIINLQIDGVIYDAKGNFSYDLGINKREAIVGADGVHGYKETPTEAYIEGEITDRMTLSLAALAGMTDGTVTLALANGKMVSLSDAFAAGEFKGQTEEGNISVKFVKGTPGPAEEITP